MRARPIGPTARAWAACALTAWALAAGAVAGCGDPPAPPPAALSTPFATLTAAFGPDLFDVARRARAFTPAAADALLIARRLTPSRVAPLPVIEIRRIDGDRREAAVALSVDGWPLRFDVQLAKGLDGWRITDVPPAEQQQQWLDLLGPDGLPSAPNAEPWAGGLGGHDATGRPTGQVVVVGLGSAVWVDGEAVENQRDPVVDAIRKGLQVRRRLAESVHATAVPEVVIALDGRVSASRHVLLSEWAMAAGAEGLRLAVRGPGGRPATLPLARRGPRPRGPHAPPIIVITRDITQVRLQVGEQIEAVPTQTGGRLTPGALTAALARLKPLRPVGAVLYADFEVDHARTIDLLNAWQAAAPGLPIASRRP